ncbi:MAG: hypothetical protein V1676_05455 [Candidatus Diapherotrites archaeon]
MPWLPKRCKPKKTDRKERGGGKGADYPFSENRESRFSAAFPADKFPEHDVPDYGHHPYYGGNEELGELRQRARELKLGAPGGGSCLRVLRDVGNVERFLVGDGKKFLEKFNSRDIDFSNLPAAFRRELDEAKKSRDIEKARKLVRGARAEYTAQLG